MIPRCLASLLIAMAAGMTVACSSPHLIGISPPDAGSSSTLGPDASVPLGRPICVNGGLCWELPRPQGNTLEAAFAESKDSVFVGGEAMTVLRSDGLGWSNALWSKGRYAEPLRSSLDQVPRGCHGLFATGGQAWAVIEVLDTESMQLGYHILHWDRLSGWWTATRWHSERRPAIHGSSTTDVWAAGGSSLGHWDGSAWTSYQLADANLHGVYVLGPSDAWAVGQSGAYHWDGKAWSLSSVLKNGRAVFASSGRVFVAVDSAVLVGDGTTFATGLDWGADSTGPLALTGTAADDVWAVGGQGRIEHFDGTSWSAIESGARATLRGAAALARGELLAVGDGGAMVQVVAGKASLSGDGEQTRGAINGFAGQSVKDLYAVSEGGQVLHSDGAGWTTLRTFADSRLAAAARTLDGKLLVLAQPRGGGSVVPVWDGTSWSEAPKTSSARLNALWRSPTGVFYAVGEAGSIQRFDLDDAFRPVQSPTTVDLQQVDGCGADDVWAVGSTDQQSALVHFDGKGWLLVVPPTTARLRAIRCKGTVWLGADDGVYRLDGASWTSLGNASGQIVALGVLEKQHGYVLLSSGLRQLAPDGWSSGYENVVAQPPTALAALDDGVVVGTAAGGILGLGCETQDVSGGLEVAYRGSPRGLELAEADPAKYPHVFRVGNRTSCEAVVQLEATLSGAGGSSPLGLEDLSGAAISTIRLAANEWIDAVVNTEAPRGLAPGTPLELVVNAGGFDSSVWNGRALPLTTSSTAGPPVTRSLWLSQPECEGKFAVGDHWVCESRISLAALSDGVHDQILIRATVEVQNSSVGDWVFRAGGFADFTQTAPDTWEATIDLEANRFWVEPLRQQLWLRPGVPQSPQPSATLRLEASSPNIEVRPANVTTISP